MYTSFNEYAKNKYGKKVYKLALFGGYSCPTRDGTLSFDGCAFCAKGSAHFAARGKSVDEQIETAKALVMKKAGENALYAAYFQSYTTTYMPLKLLHDMLFAAASREDICEIYLGTRPDCLPSPIVDILEEIDRIKPVFVELGLQTVREDTALFIRRGFPLKEFDRAAARLEKAGIGIVAHAIIGLPGEGAQDVINTVLHAYEAGARGVKLQLLHILEGTLFYELYRRGGLSCLSLEDYVDIVKRVLSALPEDMVVHRLTGDGAKSLLTAPEWSADKKRVLNAISAALK